MSKFWGGSSGSESESDDSSSSSSDDEKQIGNKGKATTEGNRWAMDSDSDSEEENRKVVSAKDKAWIAMESDVGSIRNAIKNNDWARIQETFNELKIKISKQDALIKKEGGVPNFYIRVLVELEDFLEVTLKDKEGQKKMSKANGRALNRMKLDLRKNNKPFEDRLKEYREKPVVSDDEADKSAEESGSGSDSDGDSDDDSSSSSSSSSDSSDSDSDSDSDDSDAKPKPKTKAKKAKGSDSDSDEWDSDSDSDSSSDEEGGADSGLTGRTKWLKVNTVEVKKKVKRVVAPGEAKVPKKEKAVAARKTAFQVAMDITEPELNKKVMEIVAQRGRRGVDTREMIRNLTQLSLAARRFGPHVEVPVLFHLMASHLDTVRNMDDFLALGDWRKCHQHLSRTMEMLEADPALTLGAVAADDIADMILAGQGKIEAKEGDEAEGEAKERGSVVRVMGSLNSLVTRLDEEYTKALQQINPHTEEYMERLRLENQLVCLAKRVTGYYERTGDLKTAAAAALVSIEHVYYKHDSIAHSVAQAQAFEDKFGKYETLHPGCLGAKSSSPDPAKAHPASASGKPSVTLEPEDVAGFLEGVCARLIYMHGDSRTRTRAMLCHIAHHALHDRFYEARDLLLMSHLQETITHADVATQILFNRAMVFLGLCAFRKGLIWDAHTCLMEICSSRVKELLAQGVQSMRYSDKNPEQEKAERRRQTPYHMHINQDLLEACHLISAMLLEVPNMATEETSDRPRHISRYFRKHVDFMHRQVFSGPPENTRDHVLVASKALMTGDWKKCAALILDDLDVWNLIPGEGVAAGVKEMVRTKVKSEALRTYLFAYSVHYDSLSLDQLCRMFDLEKRVAKGVISKMMINHELHASWDQPTETVVLHKVEPTHLQALALQYADKASQLVDSNERFLDAKTGGHKEEWGGRGGDRGGQFQGGGKGKGNWGGGKGKGGGQGGQGGGQGGKGGWNSGKGGGGKGKGGGGNRWNDRKGGKGDRNQGGNRWNDNKGGGGNRARW
mmetsp:Transcript_51455/g.117053  ORF Transcript_51455/g.117053 Transcript_51455/m.117053 type:complete len:1013 (+) Transcript_51455:114-3152(+)